MPPVVSPRPRQRPTPLLLLAALLSAALVFTVVAVSAPAGALAATTMAPACDGVNARTGPSTAYRVRTSLGTSARLAVTTTVSGGWWRATCAGRTVSGSTWVRISAINGRSVSSLYGVSYLYVASGLVKSVATTSTASASTQNLVVACAVNLRTSASTRATVRRVLPVGARVTVSGTVSGGSWRTTCGGRTTSGTSWYRITAIGSRSVSSLYGVRYLYAATSLFKPAPNPAPAAETLYAACDDVLIRSSASTSASRRTSVDAGTAVTVVGTVSGGSWSAVCAGKAVAGDTWLRISAIEGRSISSLYGTSYAYAASGLFATSKPLAPLAPPPAPAIELDQGIDVSHWQGTVDWAQVAAAGTDFVFLKASEGTSHVDPTYARNLAGARAAGLVVGAYHFARPDGTPGDAVAEADHFVSTAEIARGDLLPVLDIERSGGLSASELRAWAAAFLARVHERTGLRAIVYTFPAFWSGSMGNTTWFAGNGYPVLWIAHWTTASSPSVPASNWGGHGWTFWQYSSTGRVPGIGTYVDLNRFQGDVAKVLVP